MVGLNLTLDDAFEPTPLPWLRIVEATPDGCPMIQALR